MLRSTPWHQLPSFAVHTISVQPKLNRTKAAAIGAIAAVVVVIVSQSIGNTPPNTRGLPYWGGVGVGGALIGLVVAALMDRRR